MVPVSAWLIWKPSRAEHHHLWTNPVIIIRRDDAREELAVTQTDPQTAETVRPATDELVDLLAAMRPPEWPTWPELYVRGVLVGAQQAGMPWHTCAHRLVSLAAEPDASPRDLLAELPATKAHGRVDPHTAHRGAELARELMTRTETDV